MCTYHDGLDDLLAHDGARFVRHALEEVHRALVEQGEGGRLHKIWRGGGTGEGAGRWWESLSLRPCGKRTSTEPSGSREDSADYAEYVGMRVATGRGGWIRRMMAVEVAIRCPSPSNPLPHPFLPLQLPKPQRLTHQVVILHWGGVVVEEGEGVVGLDQEVVLRAGRQAGQGKGEVGRQANRRGPELL